MSSLAWLFAIAHNWQIFESIIDTFFTYYLNHHSSSQDSFCYLGWKCAKTENTSIQSPKYGVGEAFICDSSLG